VKRWILLLILPLAAPVATADFSSALSAYERGEYQSARQEFLTLAQQGDAGAQYMLGRLYEQGLGAPQDYVEAHAWYNLAAAQGRTEARQARDQLEARMTPTLVAQAQQRARDLSAGAGGSGYPGETGAGYPGSGYPAETGGGYPPPGGAGPGYRGSGYPGDTGSGYPAPGGTGSGYPGDTGSGYPGSGYPGDTGAGYPPPGDTGSGYPGSGYPGDTGAGYPPPGDTGSGYPGSGYPGDTGSGYPGSGYPGGTYPEPGYPAAGGALLSETFADGDYTQNPAWQVTLGRFWVDPDFGLRSVETAGPAIGGDEDSKAGLAFLGQLLEQASGMRVPLAFQEKAKIHLPTSIPEAFTLRLDLNSRRRAGAFAFGPYQGPEQGASYQLVYRPGRRPGLELQRVSGLQRVSLGRYADLLVAEDGRDHSIEWRRSSTGEMRVLVDGRELLVVTDTQLRGPFDGLQITNHGGDYGVHQVSVEQSY
jgi:hypothetical protein